MAHKENIINIESRISTKHASFNLEEYCMYRETPNRTCISNRRHTPSLGFILDYFPSMKMVT